MQSLIQFKKAIPQSAHLLRGTFYTVLLVTLCAMPFALAQRNATKQSVAKPANIIVVTNTNDSGSGSLRDALAAANDGDTIDATGVSGTILLTSGELQINHNVTINGPGAGNLAVNGNATSRVFENFASNVTISGFTITNGFITDATGGGILNHGGLTVTNSVISGNRARNEATCTAMGGGLSADSGTVTVSNSEINGNQVTGGGGLCVPSGGGIDIGAGATLTVTNSSISGNSADGGGGIASGGASGGATLTVTNSSISGNSAGSGGGIGSRGTLTVTNSSISGNSGGFAGGGIDASGTVTVTNSTISDNQFFCHGGGIYFLSGQLTVVNSTFSGNNSSGIGAEPAAAGCGPEPEGGGGISNGGALTVINCTISGNHADLSTVGAGGGIFNGGNLTVTNSTISGNTADTPGWAIYNRFTANIGDAVLNGMSTIFNDGGTVTSLGYNLASDDGGGVLTGPGDQINTDPMLGPLQDNGGPTFTHALLPGSLAINAGDPNFTPPPFYDQRGPGYPRVVNGRIDIGSFEVPRANPTPRPRPTPAPRP